MILLNSVNERVAGVEQLLHPRRLSSLNWFLNLVLKRNFDKALQELKAEIAFDRDSEVVGAVLGERTYRENLLVRITDPVSVKMRLAEMADRATERLATADDALNDFDAAQAELAAFSEASDLSVSKLQAAIRQAGLTDAPDSAFSPAPVHTLLDQLSTTADQVSSAGLRNPLGNVAQEARLTALLEAGTLLIDALAPFDEILGYSKLTQTLASLDRRGIAGTWAVDRLRKSSERLAELTGDLSDPDTAAAQIQDQAAELRDFKVELQTLLEDVRSAAAIEVSSRTELATSLNELASRLGETQGELVRLLGAALASESAAPSRLEIELAPQRPAEDLVPLEAAVLHEREADPFELLSAARQLLEEVRRSLGRGDLANARQSMERVNALRTRSEGLVEAARLSLTGHVGRAGELERESTRIVGEIVRVAEVIDALTQSYPPSVFLLGAGDPSHPNANGTLSDNAEEIQPHLAQAAIEVARANLARREGRLVTASGHLDAAAEQLRLARFRVSEVDEKNGRVNRAVAENATARTGLVERLRGPTAETLGASYIQPTTAAAFRQLRADLAARTGPVDPFVEQEALQLLAGRHQQLEAAALRDRGLRDALSDRVAALGSAMAALTELDAQAERDGAPDSVATTGARSEVEGLQARFESLRTDADGENESWQPMLDVAASLSTDVVTVAATLRGELTVAETALRALSRARSAVQVARDWEDLEYGVTISRQPGERLLTQAEERMAEAQYEEASELASQAQVKANEAVTTANRKVENEAEAAREKRRRLQRERERREEAMRPKPPVIAPWAPSPSPAGGGNNYSGMAASAYQPM